MKNVAATAAKSTRTPDPAPDSGQRTTQRPPPESGVMPAAKRKKTECSATSAKSGAPTSGEPSATPPAAEDVSPAELLRKYRLCYRQRADVAGEPVSSRSTIGDLARALVLHNDLPLAEAALATFADELGELRELLYWGAGADSEHFDPQNFVQRLEQRMRVILEVLDRARAEGADAGR